MERDLLSGDIRRYLREEHCTKWQVGRGGAMLARQVRNTDFEVPGTRVQIPAPALNSCVALGGLLNFSRSLFLNYKMR